MGRLYHDNHRSLRWDELLACERILRDNQQFCLEHAHREIPVHRVVAHTHAHTDGNVDPDAYADSNTNTYADSNTHSVCSRCMRSEPNSNPNRNTYSCPQPDAYSDCHADSESDTDSHSHSVWTRVRPEPDSNSNVNSNSNSYPNSNANSWNFSDTDSHSDANTQRSLTGLTVWLGRS